MWIAFALAAFAQDAAATAAAAAALTPDMLAAAGGVIGLELTEAEIELMLADVGEQLAHFEALRGVPLENGDAPAWTFSPLVPGVEPRTFAAPPGMVPVDPAVERPADLEELAFADIATLAALVRSRKVSCVELARLSIDRLRRLDGTLRCVITFTEERALARAAELDRELAEGKWRGLLHGIPWGAKDLLATAGVRTTWGAAPYREQVLDFDATVVERLDAAGAVLVAKLSLGALAWGDVWFDATTRNPWNPEQGSSGSSAGSAAAVAAGGVTFAIGSETLGSIVSPSTRCGCSSLRPTFGRVSRHGAMTLCWSLDKLGPMCRSAEDAAIVFGAIHGPDGRDPSVHDRPFRWPGPISVEGWRVGFPRGAFGDDPGAVPIVGELLALGVQLVEVDLPSYPVDAMMIVLGAEAATAFDELTRSGEDDRLVRQERRAWPNVLRAARLVPAVEYLRAQRLRVKLMRDLDAALAGVDVLVHPSYHGDLLAMTNLTGHPTFVCPDGFREGRDGVRVPTSISFTGHLFDEARLLALVHRWQLATGYEDEHPPLAFLEEDGGAAGGGR